MHQVRIPQRYRDQVAAIGIPLTPIKKGRWVGRVLGPSWVLPLLDVIDAATQVLRAPVGPLEDIPEAFYVDWDKFLAQLAGDTETAEALAAALALAGFGLRPEWLAATPNDDAARCEAFMKVAKGFVHLPLHPKRTIGRPKSKTLDAFALSAGSTRRKGYDYDTDE